MRRSFDGLAAVPSVAQEPLTVALVSLGCAKNLVDSEVMLGALARDGFALTANARQADVVLVNTCSFIEPAQQESVDAILEAHQAREMDHREQVLIVAGCLPQRFQEDLLRSIPEVDAFIGVDQVAEIPRLVREARRRRAQRLASVSTPAGLALSDRGPRRNEGRGRSDRAKPTHGGASEAETSVLFEVGRRPAYIPDYETPRFRLTPRHSAYLKIAEGCNHPCTFCIIPRIRGRHRSRPLADVVEEARHLLGEGVKELNLISQDSTYYGTDLRRRGGTNEGVPGLLKPAAPLPAADGPTLAGLLRALNDLEGDFWIRLLYTHPAHWTDDLISTIAACPKVVRYVDLPLQHIDDRMLRRMRRETSSAQLEDLIGRIRAGIPGIALRTTFIVGFPGETEAIFGRLLEFIRQTRFERLGVFPYSPQEGTVAASMAGQVPETVRQHRRDRIMEEQLSIARSIGAAFVGRRLRVLVERNLVPSTVPASRRPPRPFPPWRAIKGRSATESPRGQSPTGPGGESGVSPHRDPMRSEGSHSGRDWDGPLSLARAEADAPDVDGRVYIQGCVPAEDFAWVTVVGHTDYDLIARPG